MDVIRRKINLKPFTERVFGSESVDLVSGNTLDGIVYDILYPDPDVVASGKTLDGIVYDIPYPDPDGDRVVSGRAIEAGYIPVAYGNRVWSGCTSGECGEEGCEEINIYGECGTWLDPEPVIRWDTFVRYYRFILNFIVESVYYTIVVRKNGENDIVKIVPVPRYSCKATSGETEDDFEIAKNYFLGSIGVYGSTDEAVSDTDVVKKENCGKIITINENSKEFWNMFLEGIKSVKDFLGFIENAVSSESPFVEIPIDLSSDVKEMGPAEVYMDFWRPGETYTRGCVVYHYDDDGELYAYLYDGETPISGDTFDVEQWEKLVFYDNSGTSIVNELVASKLSTLRRDVRSYDSNGNELPYVESGNTKQLPYIVDVPMNVVYEDGVCKYSVLTKIEYFDEHGNIQEDSTNINYDNGLTENGTVKFTYSVDVDEETGEGLVYEETRQYAISGRTGDNYGYIVISDDTIEYPEWDTEEGHAYATILSAFNGEPISENPFLIRGGVLLDVNDIKVDNSSVNIVRGTAASYEAFNVLGEMNTIDDIEKYRDDWYRIKGKND